MKEIIFNGKTKNYYHTIVERSIEIHDQLKRGKAITSGFTKEKIEIGDVFKGIKNNVYEVIGIIQIRDHAGIFTNEEDKKDSFFRVDTKFQTIIQL